MNRLVQAFERFSGPYFAKYQKSMLTSHLKALSNISHCRTETYGQWVNACTSCGLVVEEINGACRNRAYPKCHNSQVQEWIDKAKSRLPSTAYYHLVFSVPCFEFRVREAAAMKFYIYNRDESPPVEKEEKEGMERLPYNKLIEPIARGRHAFREAKAAPVPEGRVRTGLAPPPCSRLISTLYGRWE